MDGIGKSIDFERSLLLLIDMLTFDLGTMARLAALPMSRNIPLSKWTFTTISRDI